MKPLPQPLSQGEGSNMQIDLANALACTLYVLPSFGGVGGGSRGLGEAPGLPDFRRSSSGKPFLGRAHDLTAFNQTQNQNSLYD